VSAEATPALTTLTPGITFKSPAAICLPTLGDTPFSDETDDQPGRGLGAHLDPEHGGDTAEHALHRHQDDRVRHRYRRRADRAGRRRSGDDTPSVVRLETDDYTLGVHERPFHRLRKDLLGAPDECLQPRRLDPLPADTPSVRERPYRRHIAPPLPSAGPSSGATSSCWITRAPAACAIRALPSAEAASTRPRDRPGTTVFAMTPAIVAAHSRTRTITVTRRSPFAAGSSRVERTAPETASARTIREREIGGQAMPHPPVGRGRGSDDDVAGSDPGRAALIGKPRIVERLRRLDPADERVGTGGRAERHAAK
jgi:hypothetical protein